EGVTDNLIEATRLAQISNKRGYRRIVATLRTRHLALIDHLSFQTTERQAIHADIDRLLFEMLDELQSVAASPSDRLEQRTVDHIIGVGERMAARIVAALIRQNNIRAVAIDTPELIITDNNFGNATPDIGASCARIQRNLLPMLERSIVPVITGYIGATPEGEQTTLGRGGSDYSASVIGICSNADEVWLWTDVDGMMTTDPRDIPSARAIDEMAFQEVGEMAYFGARVLHPRMVGPLSEVGIPLRIKNVFKPQQPGTLISNVRQPQQTPKAVTLIYGFSLTAEYSGPLSGIAALVNEVLWETAGSPAEVMISSQSSMRTRVCFIVPTSSGPGALRNTIDAVTAALENENPHWAVAQVSVVTVVGAQINRKPSIIAQLIAQLEDIKILELSPSPSDCTLSIILNPEDGPTAQERIHDYLLQSHTKDS
ncbi:MAG: aspartate kinase, partial [Chloroflexota bacterium]